MDFIVCLASLGDSVAGALAKVITQIKEDPFWVTLGFAGQAVFFSRFLCQWVVSERRKESFIPVYFWYLSIVGSLMVLAYAIHLVNPVFILAYGTGLFIYIRNLTLIHAKRAQRVQP